MNDFELTRWRDNLRADYKQAFAPPAKRFATALPWGTLWMLDQPGYEAWVMVSELPTVAGECEEPTWNAWAAEEASWRHRRITSRHS